MDKGKNRVNTKKSEEQNQTQSSSFFKEMGGFMKPYQGRYILSILISVLSVWLSRELLALRE